MITFYHITKEIGVKVNLIAFLWGYPELHFFQCNYEEAENTRAHIWTHPCVAVSLRKILHPTAPDMLINV